MKTLAIAMFIAVSCSCVATDEPSDLPDAGEVDPDAEEPTAAQLDATLGSWVIDAPIDYCEAGVVKRLALRLHRREDVIEVSVTGAKVINAGAELYPFRAHVRLEEAHQAWDLELRDGQDGPSAKVVWSDTTTGACSVVVDGIIVERTR